ncbi:MAG: ABC transporter ATP-binding protein [bacterium]|nr:ABC transporter ATP-binding protein [bacterium]
MLTLSHINKTYVVGEEPVHALIDVSLEVQDGEFVAICGPSGSGKTTLMNVMGCLDLPDSGSYLLDGVDVAACSDRELSAIRSEKIGFIFQQFNLLDQMSAIENVELPLIYQKVPQRERTERAKEALELVGLANRMRHRPSQLSGGQQQRVAIARALASRSRVILADEPTGNLDSRSGDDVMQLISDLSGQGSTIVLITHNQRVADMAQRTVYVHDGRLYDASQEVHQK